MPTLHKTPFGRVTAIWGHALIRGTDGQMHALKIGDVVHDGDVILTSQNGIVQLEDPHGATRLATALPGDEAGRVINALNSDDPNAATAAGISGGDGSLQPGLRVDRISEGLSSAGFQTASVLDARPFAFVDSHAAPAGGSPVAPVSTNEPPTATPGAFGGNEDTTIPVSLGGSDSDGSVVAVTVVSIPAGSTLLLGDGTTPVIAGQALTPAQAADLLFKPAHDFNGDVQVTFTVTDNQGATSSPGTVQIGVTPVNDAPVAHDDNATGAAGDALTTPEDTALTIAPATMLANDSDVDGDTLTITSVQGATHGTVAIVAGQVVFTPDANYNGPANFTYTVSDGHGGTASATVNVDVTPVNDPPTPRDDNATGAAGDALTTPEDTALTIAPATLLANDSDVDGDTLTITSVQDATHGTVAIVAGQVVFTPDANYNGPANFTYTVSDGHGGTASATVNVDVTPVNDPPVAVADSLTTDEDAPLTIAPATLLANDSDVDGDALTIASVQGATHGTVAIVDGQVVFTPDANYNGPASFTYTVSDGNGGSSTATVSIDVKPVNDPPVAVVDSLSTDEDTALTIAPATLLANDSDVDGDTLTITSVQGATHGTVAIV
ncbi:MAG TPA: tandem-95 repeat protein, partial [Ideonella sp.]|nr:tandem-95 repeat protein [Ideonella sp.]